MPHKAPDWLEDAVTQAPQWEPPSGFALRVTATARQRQTPTEARVQRQRLLHASWWRLSFTGMVKALMQNTLWVLRQYLTVLGR
jgi:hypothetical protein